MILRYILLLSSLLGSPCVCTANTKDYRQKWPLTRQDIVVAMPVDKNHLTLAKGSRVWRRGVRALIASNEKPSAAQVEEGNMFNETWTWWPDDLPQRSMYVGDTRAAIVPFLAHKQLGDTYKWLLYGDDDTVWFMEGVLDFLADLDPDMPYFISDHLWWSNAPGRASHPNRDAPRCLPCNYPDHHLDQSKAPFRAPKGCPCTPQLLCSSDRRGIFNEFCDIPRAPVATYSMHGGAGGIMSVGLLRAVSLQYMEMCIKSLYSTGGDAFISICLWQAGYAVTDPGFSFYHPEVQMFDPGPEDRMGVMLKLVRALDSNRCDVRCQNMLDHMLTIHVRSRVFPTMDDAAQFVKAIVTLYDVYVESKHQHVLQEQARVVAEAAAKAAAKAKEEAETAAAAQAEAQAAKDQAAEQNAKAQAENALKLATRAVEVTQKKASEAEQAAGRAATAAAALEAARAGTEADASDMEGKAATDVNWGKGALSEGAAVQARAGGAVAAVDQPGVADLADDGMRVRVQAADVASAALGMLNPVQGVGSSSDAPELRGRAATARRELPRNHQHPNEDGHSAHMQTHALP